MTLLGRSPVASLDALAAACSRGIIVFINTVQLWVSIANPGFPLFLFTLLYMVEWSVGAPEVLGFRFLFSMLPFGGFFATMEG